VLRTIPGPCRGFSRGATRSCRPDDPRERFRRVRAPRGCDPPRRRPCAAARPRAAR